jgi:hypothetical protein
MKIFFHISIIVSLFICIFVIFMTELYRKPILKDCSIAEISPDFTVKEKNECRKLRKYM